MGAVKLYGNHCPKCIMLEQMLKTSKIPYEAVNATPEEIREKGFDCMPLLFVNDKYLTFEEARQWIKDHK